MIGRRMPYYVKRGIGGIDANTVLMLHGEDLLDASNLANTVTNHGVTTNSSYKKVGSNSLYFNGSSYLSIPNSSAFNFGTGDFTVEWWEYRLDASYARPVFMIQTSATDESLRNAEMVLGWYQSSIMKGLMSSNGTSSWDFFNEDISLGSIKINQWAHRAFVRNGNNFLTFENGALVATKTSSLSMYYNSSWPIIIGARSSIYYYGYLDELRVSNVARWTANFTPPTEPYSK